METTTPVTIFLKTDDDTMKDGLIWAASAGQLKLLQVMHQDGVSLVAHNNIALCSALRTNQRECCDFLIDKKVLADVEDIPLKVTASMLELAAKVEYAPVLDAFATLCMQSSKYTQQAKKYIEVIVNAQMQSRIEAVIKHLTENTQNTTQLQNYLVQLLAKSSQYTTHLLHRSLVQFTASLSSETLQITLRGACIKNDSELLKLIIEQQPEAVNELAKINLSNIILMRMQNTLRVHPDNVDAIEKAGLKLAAILQYLGQFQEMRSSGITNFFFDSKIAFQAFNQVYSHLTETALENLGITKLLKSYSSAEFMSLRHSIRNEFINSTLLDAKLLADYTERAGEVHFLDLFISSKISQESWMKLYRAGFSISPEKLINSQLTLQYQTRARFSSLTYVITDDVVDPSRTCAAFHLNTFLLAEQYQLPTHLSAKIVDSPEILQMVVKKQCSIQQALSFLDTTTTSASISRAALKL